MEKYNFKQYLRYLGLNDEEAKKLSESCHSWDQFHEWLNNNQRVASLPGSDRTSIGAPFLETHWKKNLWNRLHKSEESYEAIEKDTLWPKIVDRRRHKAMIISLVLTGVMTEISNITLVSEKISDNSRHIYLIVYSIMSYFMIATFTKLALGTWHSLRGAKGNPHHPIHTARNPQSNVRIAIIYPVYHESAERVVAGLTATWESIKRNVPDYADQYDLFLLSDSRNPEFWIAEQAAIHAAQAANPDAHFYYRWRPSNKNAKLGNVLDFCRRWGKTYKYMIVMDADSLMNGDTIHQMVCMMEGNHRLGILQSNPTPIMRKSLFGRMQQFSGRLYGTVFSYSLQSMYMGHAQYIGHNAILRIEPFINYCMLPELSGSPPWGGKPLSHDIVEAAMMARAGYEVWFIPELEGSYEEIPSNILGFLTRERRWMQGNLQHLRFLFVNGLHTIHRETFINGLMGYLSAPLWAVFLFISAFSMLSFIKHSSISIGSLSTIGFPTIFILSATLIFLFLPRIIAIAINFSKSKSKRYGGRSRLLLSILLETFFSMFFSPIIMVYITKFVWQWVTRKSISWGTQQRDDTNLPWADCFKHFGWVVGVGSICSYLLYQQMEHIPAQRIAMIGLLSGHLFNTSSLFFWFFPILGGLSFSIIIVRFTSRSFPFLKKMKLFMTPEETNIPVEISDLEKWCKYLYDYVPDPENTDQSFSFAIGNPFFYIYHRPQTRLKPHVAKVLLPKIKEGIPLTVKEFTYALRERRCFDAMHKKYVMSNRH